MIAKSEVATAIQPEVNADCTEMVCVHTLEMEWEPTGHAGVSQKVVERVNDPEKGRETMLLRLEPGAKLPTEATGDRVEIFVMEGTYNDEHGAYGQYTFILNPPGFSHTPSSKDGCVIYLKRRRPFRAEAETERMVVDTQQVEWLAFPQRKAEVLHLYKDPNGIDTRRFGHVFPNAQIAQHGHPTGEEVFVIEGHLCDQLGDHGPGTWMRAPVSFRHAPFTRDDGVRMFIREGDNYW